MLGQLIHTALRPRKTLASEPLTSELLNEETFEHNGK